MNRLALASILSILLANVPEARADIVVPDLKLRKRTPRLVIEVRPGAAKIMLQGQGLRVQGTGRLVRRGMPPGSYRVTVSLKHHKTQTRQIKVFKKGNVRLRMILKQSEKTGKGKDKGRGKRAGKPPSA